MFVREGEIHVILLNLLGPQLDLFFITWNSSTSDIWISNIPFSIGISPLQITYSSTSITKLL